MKYGLPEVGPLERALYLRSLTLFRTLTASELAACAQLMQERYIRRGEILYEAGSPPRALHLLVDGRVRLEHQGNRLGDLEASEDVGLVELLCGQPHRSRAVAETNALALVVDGGALLDLVEEHFSFFLQMRHALGTEVARQQQALGSYHTLPEPCPAVGSHGSVLDLAEALLALQETTVFRDVGLAILAALASQDRELRLEPDVPLWQRADEPTFLALIVNGIVSCVPEPSQHAFRAGPGVLLGVDAVFGGTPYAYRATAETPVIARCIDAQLLLDMAEDHFVLASRMLAHCACELLRLKDASDLQASLCKTAPEPRA